MNKQIYRSNTNRVIGGVCGGLGEYLDISADIVRVLWVLMTFVSGGFGFLLYILCLVLIPQAPLGYSQEQSFDFNSGFNNALNLNNKKTKIILGGALICIGVILTLKKLFNIDDVFIYSIVLILVGVYIIAKGGKE